MKKGILKSDVVNELVAHGQARTKKINNRQRNKDEAILELLEHYEQKHNDLILNCDRQSDSDDEYSSESQN